MYSFNSSNALFTFRIITFTPSPAARNDSIDIDGHVYFTAAGPVPAGEFVNVRITGTQDGDLTGEIEE